MSEQYKKVLNGEEELSTVPTEEMSAYRKFVEEEVGKEQSKVAGLRQARRDLEGKADTTGGEKPKEVENPIATESDSEIAKFRNDQVMKARRSLKATFNLTDEQEEAAMDKFKKLDSGSYDADTILEDMKSAAAAANPTKFAELMEEDAQQRQRAAEETARQAGAQGAGSEGAGNTGSKEAEQLAQKADISVESAQKTLDNGMQRTY